MIANMRKNWPTSGLFLTMHLFQNSMNKFLKSDLNQNDISLCGLKNYSKIFLD